MITRAHGYLHARCWQWRTHTSLHWEKGRVWCNVFNDYCGDYWNKYIFRSTNWPWDKKQ
jgi:hypothetical protein